MLIFLTEVGKYFMPDPGNLYGPGYMVKSQLKSMSKLKPPATNAEKTIIKFGLFSQ